MLYLDQNPWMPPKLLELANKLEKQLVIGALQKVLRRILKLQREKRYKRGKQIE